jgi:hypothetical protein
MNLYCEQWRLDSDFCASSIGEEKRREEKEEEEGEKRENSNGRNKLCRHMDRGD